MIDHREIFVSMTDVEFNQWRHSPITAAVLAFLGDQYTNTRDGIAGLVENGHFTIDGPTDTNLHYLRGRLDVMRELQGIAVAHIQGFYREEAAARQEARQDDGNTRATPPQGGAG